MAVAMVNHIVMDELLLGRVTFGHYELILEYNEWIVEYA